MDNLVSFYFAKGLAPSTHKAYTSAQNRYLHFCSANNLQPLPLSETPLSQFVTGLANSSLKHQTTSTPSNAKFDPGCHLSPADISIDDLSHPSILRICIKQSKTDPFRKGVHIIVGATGDCLCPVAAVLQYIAIRGKEPGPLFRFSNGSALTRQNFVSSVRRALSGIGLQTSLYSGHSFRIGAATTAAAQGISDALIKTMGRWESIAYTTYIQTPIDQIAAVSRRLL